MTDEGTIVSNRLGREDAARDLLDALAMPDGRNVRAAWDRMCLLHGRFGWAMKLAAFEQYLDELAAGGSR